MINIILCISLLIQINQCKIKPSLAPDVPVLSCLVCMPALVSGQPIHTIKSLWEVTDLEVGHWGDASPQS